MQRRTFAALTTFLLVPDNQQDQYGFEMQAYEEAKQQDHDARWQLSEDNAPNPCAQGAHPTIAGGMRRELRRRFVVKSGRRAASASARKVAMQVPEAALAATGSD